MANLMNKIFSFLALFLILAGCQQKPSLTSAPNLIIILTDDQGWGDVGFNGCTDIHTPNLDALAASGVVFSQGYVSHPYCSPSRAGLLTGKYQQSFGHENNPGYPEFVDEIPDGLPLDEVLLSDILSENGYTSAAVGKWHLGDHPEFWPTNRGFQEWYGFSGGGMNYWGLASEPIKGVLHQGKPVPQEELSYLTDDFTKASVDFIKKQGKKPFFLYLAYNAPHAPIQATRAYLESTDYIEDGARSTYAAMIAGIDAGVGEISSALKEQDIFDNTLIVYLSDNGGHGMGSSCGPYRGWKGMVYEGGIRVPFCLSWPARLQGGKVYKEAISALDIFPTFLEAAGISTEDLDSDGCDLIPYLSGAKQGPPHEALFWRYTNGAGYAVRKGNFKLVNQYKKTLSLFNMETDPFEQYNLAASQPQKVTELQNLYEDWDKSNVDALWEDPHLENVEKQENARLEAVRRASPPNERSRQ